jgi:hypothetical protein
MYIFTPLNRIYLKAKRYLNLNKERNGLRPIKKDLQNRTSKYDKFPTVVSLSSTPLKDTVVQ